MGIDINAFIEYRNKESNVYEWCDSFDIGRDYKLFKALGWLDDNKSLNNIKHRSEPNDKSSRLEAFLSSDMFDSPQFFGSWLSIDEICDIYDHADDLIKNELCCIINYMRCLACKYDVRFIYWFD